MYAKTINKNTRPMRAAEAAMKAAKVQENKKPAIKPAADAPLQPMPLSKGDPVVVRMAGTFGSIWHPDQSKYIPDDVNGIELTYDNWLRCQIAAKLVEVVS